MLNKFKEFYKNTYGMLITLSWILLIVCLIIKLFGGNWFELNSDNSKFIEFCNYVETHQALKMSIACVISVTSTFPIISSIYNFKDFKFKHILCYSLILIIKSIIGWYIPIISTIIDFIILIIVPFIITKNWKRIIIINVFVLLFQIISIIIRNISFNFNVGNTLVETYLIQIDYYIMLCLLYFYNFKRKEKI